MWQDAAIEPFHLISQPPYSVFFRIFLLNWTVFTPILSAPKINNRNIYSHGILHLNQTAYTQYKNYRYPRVPEAEVTYSNAYLRITVRKTNIKHQNLDLHERILV